MTARALAKVGVEGSNPFARSIFPKSPILQEPAETFGRSSRIWTLPEKRGRCRFGADRRPS
jgi:hypothetical protein